MESKNQEKCVGGILTMGGWGVKKDIIERKEAVKLRLDSLSNKKRSATSALVSHVNLSM